MEDLDGEIYDEFGNYIGPDLDENQGESDGNNDDFAQGQNLSDDEGARSSENDLESQIRSKYKESN